MYSSKTAAGAIILRRHTLLQNGFISRCFSSASTPPPPEGGSEGVGEKAKKRMDDVLGATKDTSEKLKERVMGSETNSSRPSKDPDQNHGVESTDSSCEDVRSRPGGYS